MGSNPAGGEILPEPKQRFIARSPSCSPFHCLEMTEILLKGRKTLTHPSIYAYNCRCYYALMTSQVVHSLQLMIDISISRLHSHEKYWLSSMFVKPEGLRIENKLFFIIP